MHEASLYKSNVFLTLTYNEDQLPPNGSLHYPHYQKFMRRLRFNFPRCRFYMCGEYGEKEQRPHYHACVFNIEFPDMVYFKRSPSGEDIYRSPKLERLWKHGYSSIGALTFESAAYVARYVLKKRTGDSAQAHYERITPDGEIIALEPEFAQMSLKPGIGAEWFNQFHADVYPHDYVIVRGQKMRPPKYYDRRMTKLNLTTWEEVENKRQEKIAETEPDTPARLKVKEEVTRSRIQFKKRGKAGRI